MSLSPLQRDGFHHEHRNDLARQRRADMEAAEQERQRNERELSLKRGDIRRKEADLHEREDRLIEREGRLAQRERDANITSAETLAAEIHTGPADRALVSGNPNAVAMAILAAHDKALKGCPPDSPTGLAAEMLKAHAKACGLIDDDGPKLTGTAAKMIEIARKQGLA